MKICSHLIFPGLLLCFILLWPYDSPSGDSTLQPSTRARASKHLSPLLKSSSTLHHTTKVPHKETPYSTKLRPSAKHVRKSRELKTFECVLHHSETPCIHMWPDMQNKHTLQVLCTFIVYGTTQAYNTMTGETCTVHCTTPSVVWHQAVPKPL